MLFQDLIRTELTPLDVCVVIPTFNRSELLNRTLESLENQNCGTFQIAICNDFSDDDTSTVVTKWKENSRHKIISIDNEINQGPSYSFKAAVELSHSEYILALGDDDILYPNHIAEMHKQIDRDPNLAAVFCRDEGWKSAISLLRTRLAFQGDTRKGVIGTADLLAGNSIHGPGALFRRGVFADEPMHQANIYCQDYELWLHLSFHGFLKHSTLKMRYGKTPGSLSSQSGSGQALDLGLSIRRFLGSKLFRRYLRALSELEQATLNRIFASQLNLLSRKAPLAHAFAVFNSPFESGQEHWGKELVEILQQVTEKHDSVSGWTLDLRKSAIKKLDAWADSFGKNHKENYPLSFALKISSRVGILAKSIARSTRLRSLEKLPLPWEVD